jgi:4-aminobutyrate aminotransferase
METHAIPGEKARDFLERDAKVVSPSYPRAYPFMMERGKDCEVWDVDGNRYLDFAAGIAVCSTGHSHPKVVQAVKDQAERFLHISSDYYHPIWVEFSEKLAATAPFSDPAKIFLGNSGTEAVEAAIKLSRYHTGRQGILGFFGAFHGRTMGSLAITASKSLYKTGFAPTMSGVFHAPFPDPYRPLLAASENGYGETVVRFIHDVILKKVLPPEDCAAVIVEPIQGEGGYIVPPDDFFPALRELCDDHGILLIVDEIQSGVGRTGKMWAIEHWDVEPDIVCTAKGIASGIPLGGIITRSNVMDWPAGAHGNTYGGNPVACAAGIATLELIEGGLMENASQVGEYTLDALAEIQARHPSIGDVRGKGLMIGVDFVLDRASKAHAHDVREAIVHTAFQRGLLTLGCGESTIRIAPPLTITPERIDEGLGILEAAIQEVEEKIGD